MHFFPGNLKLKINIDFHSKIAHRMATERELEKSDALHQANIEFDCSGHFIVYPTMIGIKLVNIETNRCIRIIGKGDNLRPLHVSLFQGRTKKPKAALSLEQEASENPILAQTNADPTLFITAFKYVYCMHSAQCTRTVIGYVISPKS